MSDPQAISITTTETVSIKRRANGRDASLYVDLVAESDDAVNDATHVDMDVNKHQLDHHVQGSDSGDAGNAANAGKHNCDEPPDDLSNEDSNHTSGATNEDYDVEGSIVRVQSAKGMSMVMQGILSTSTTNNVDIPILAKDKSTLRHIVEQQEEDRLTQLQVKSKQAKLDLAYVKPAEYSLNHEKLLRKMATKGGT